MRRQCRNIHVRRQIQQIVVRRTMNSAHPSGEHSSDPAVDDELAPAGDAIPRWAQVVTGLVLLPLSALCSIGAVSIFGIPKVQSDPLPQLLAAAICLLCVWAVVLATRLLLGLKGKYGLMGPFALRAISVVAIFLVVAGLFSEVLSEHPFRTAMLSACYVVIAVRLWKIASFRSSSIAQQTHAASRDT